MLLEPGDKFDRYTIEGLLGQGGMGRVYRATDAKLQRKVALKLLRLDVADAIDDDMRAKGSARLLREARAAAALDHANAIAIHDVGEVDGVPYIAMELVDGSSLRTRIGDASVPIQTRIRWLVDVARALGAAHDRGLIHRDIKPENVMVRRDGVVKVLDFGIARAQLSMGDDAAALTPRGVLSLPAVAGQTADWWTNDSALVGTPRYMAPEQLRAESLDGRSDQFAWGVVAYELLTGLPLWTGSALSLTLVSSILSDDPIDPERLLDACPPHIARTVLRALSKNREDRFASMHDVARELETSGSRLRRRMIALTAVAAIGVAATAAVLAFSHKPPPTSPASLASLAVSSAPVAPVATRLTDLPTPASDVAEAKAAYVAGLHALHDASIVPAVRHFVHATELDPSMAAAHLRLITHGRAISETDEQLHFAKARELHALLSPRDQALLSALEPSFLAVPADEKEVTRRLRELADQWPLDAEILYLAASRELDAKAAAGLFEHVLAIDPQFSLALWRKANGYLMVSDFPNTLEGLDRCVALSPSSTSCLTVRALVYEELGRCKDMEHDARVLEYVSPSARTHDLVARVLFANGAALQAVREALERKWSTAAEKQRAGYKLDDEAHLAILSGDFASAERWEREAAAEIERSASENDHSNTTIPLVQLDLEMGKQADAGRVADHYLKARAAWQSTGAWAPVPQLFAVAVHAGLRTDADRAAARAEWLRLWDNTDALFRPQSWVLGYAVPAMTEAEGAEALAAAPKPLPRVHTNQFHREGLGSIGKVLMLAGHGAEAVPILRAATATCSALQAPLDHTQAHLHLGRALEQTGDAAGACAAYAVVLERWGGAKPRSISADFARTRRRALACR